MPVPTPTPDLDELRRLVADGLTFKQIGAHYGVTRPVLLRWLDQNGIPRPRGNQPYRNPLKTSESRAWQATNTQDKIDAICTEAMLDRFWKKVRKMDGCWEWTAAISQARGYGFFNFAGFNIFAHRVSWMIHKGPIPANRFVLHRCDNRICVNPDHLFIGTNQDNYDDRDSKGRVAHGESSAASKLTEADVLAIYHAKGKRVDIAKRFRVHPAHVSNIKNKKQWKRLLARV